MRLSIPGVRPPLLSSDDALACLDELRAFRHAFRPAYSYGLDDDPQCENSCHLPRGIREYNRDFHQRG